MLRKSSAILAPLILGSLLMSGCAALQSPEDSLKERATAYWNAKKINDATTAYKYEDFSLTGEYPIQNYVKRSTSIEYRSIDIKSIKLLSANEGEVNLDIAYTLPGTIITKPINSNIRDYWVKIEDQWYRAKPIDKKPDAPAQEKPKP